jgi:uncharacterized protein HemX
MSSVEMEIRRTAATHRVLLDEFEQKLRALAERIARAREVAADVDRRGEEDKASVTQISAETKGGSPRTWTAN